jgi:membrane fusion protein, multidrug efflux system
MKKGWLIFGVVLAVAVGGTGWWYYTVKKTGATSTAEKKAEAGKGARKGKGKGKGPGGPLSVRVERVRVQPMPVVIDTIGTIEPEQSVAVRAQVSGVLGAVNFREGDNVKAGQLLFRIDQRPFRASVNQSRAALARDEAQLAQARAQQLRLEPLVKQEYITKQEYDVAVTSTKSLAATVEANRAALEQAHLQLSYTEIQSPINGRTGSVSVKPGNLVTAGTSGAGQPLVVINRMHPILVAFSVSRNDLDEFRRFRDDQELHAEVTREGDSKPIAEGKLVFVDNAINPQTGAVLMKARLPNEGEQLWSGELVKVRLVLRIEPEAIVVSEAAVQPGQQGSFVYLINKEDRVRVRPVTVSRQLGDQVVIAKGLRGGERVITEVPQALTEGAQVQVRGPGEPGKKGKRGNKKGKGKGKGGEQGGGDGTKAGSGAATGQAGATQ